VTGVLQMAMGTVASGGNVPVGLIIAYEGTVASIPTGWALANGTGGTIDLSNKFIIAENATYLYNTTGGSNQDVPIAGTTSTAGAHSTNTTGGGSGGGRAGYAPLVHAGHIHTVAVNVNVTPPSYSLAYIQNLSSTTIPNGGVLWFNDTVGNIPTGYTEKTALKGNFIKGVANDVRAALGSLTPTANTTTASAGGHTHTNYAPVNESPPLNDHYYGVVGHTHDAQTGVSTTVNLPLYHALTAVAATAQTIPKANMIAAYYGALIDLPASWRNCDGTNSTPNLRGKFIIGADTTYTLASSGGTATRSITAGSAVPTNSWTHVHEGGGYGSGAGDMHNSYSVSHSHTWTASATLPLPPWKALYYIMRAA
jgi:hypothetical protein